MKNISKAWRDSATLIVLSKRNGDSVTRSIRRGVDYDILLQTRTRNASFANSLVFPGGVSESDDAADCWLDHLKLFGYSSEDFQTFHRPGTTITPLFGENPVRRHIQLRITAIRETFEELGLLIGSREHKGHRTNKLASTISDIDVKYWQTQISNNPGELLNLCKEYKCYPDIWSLHYWSNWLTPANLKKRFDAAFYVTALNCKPTLYPTTEIANVEWASPVEVLEKSDKGEVQLQPPQFYELHRLLQLQQLDELVTFTAQRSCCGDELIYPFVIKAKDGLLHILPGDELYPKTINYHSVNSVDQIDKTVLELRENCHTIHRFEVRNLEKRIIQLVFKNYNTKHHINMGEKVIDTPYNDLIN